MDRVPLRRAQSAQAGTDMPLNVCGSQTPNYMSLRDRRLPRAGVCASPGPHRVWQRRFYDLNIWSEKKRREKLDYMHNNPVKRRLVTSPHLRPWSSFRFIFLQDASIFPLDRLP